jgi:hypothetical protein
MDPDAYQFHRVLNAPANQFNGQLLVSDQVSKDDVALVWRELDGVLAAGVPGGVVEFGCYAGTTSLFIRRLLDRRGEAARPFHVYDSFEGLPEKTVADLSAAGADFQAGKLMVSKKKVSAPIPRSQLAAAGNAQSVVQRPRRNRRAARDRLCVPGWRLLRFHLGLIKAGLAADAAGRNNTHR